MRRKACLKRLIYVTYQYPLLIATQHECEKVLLSYARGTFFIWGKGGTEYGHYKIGYCIR